MNYQQIRDVYMAVLCWGYIINYKDGEFTIYHPEDFAVWKLVNGEWV